MAHWTSGPLDFSISSCVWLHSTCMTVDISIQNAPYCNMAALARILISFRTYGRLYMAVMLPGSAIAPRAHSPLHSLAAPKWAQSHWCSQTTVLSFVPQISWMSPIFPSRGTKCPPFSKSRQNHLKWYESVAGKCCWAPCSGAVYGRTSLRRPYRDYWTASTPTSCHCCTSRRTCPLLIIS